MWLHVADVLPLLARGSTIVRFVKVQLIFVFVDKVAEPAPGHRDDAVDHEGGLCCSALQQARGHVSTV